jgi:hypothetical protein
MVNETRLHESGGLAMRQRRLLLLVVIMVLVVNVSRSGRRSTSLRAAATRPAATELATTRPVSAQAESTQPAERVVLHQDFEAEKGDWGGKIITDNVPPGSTRALGATPTETHWARRATVGNNVILRGAGSTVLKFRYFISKDIPLTIYIMDRTQKDNLRYDVKKPVVGEWTDVRVNINTDFRRNDGSAGKLQVGDVLRGISFLAGKTGTDEFDMAVDDVEVTAND